MKRKLSAVMQKHNQTRLVGTKAETAFDLIRQSSGYDRDYDDTTTTE